MNRNGDHADQADHRGQRDRQRDVAARERGQDVGGRAARRGGDDHQAQRELGRHRPDTGEDEGNRRQHDDLGEGAHREVSRPARHPREVVEGEPEPESEHDEGERQRQHDIDEESHDA